MASSEPLVPDGAAECSVTVPNPIGDVLPLGRLPQNPGHFGNTHLRWSIVFAVLVVVVATVPLWLPLAAPTVGLWVNACGSLLIGLEWAVIAVCAARNYGRLNAAPVPKWDHTFALRRRRFRHIVIVPCYLDPLEILHDCIDTLACQRRPEDLCVVVTFEKKTPNLQVLVDSVVAAYRDSFGDFVVVVHELDPRTEIPGGCSNKNFALREAYHYCATKYGPETFRERRHTVTTCDTDSKFHPEMFEVLQAAYNAENPPLVCSTDPADVDHYDDDPVDAATGKTRVHMNVWQPPLFYNWDLDERPFFNRVTCLMRTMMMLGGLISFNLNPMSIFSYPLELGLAAGFINPRYGVDDIIAKVRWMCDTNSKVPVRLLPVPAISGPTVGTTFGEEVTEWGRQIRRWIVGASESFHYFIIHWRGRPFFAAASWFVLFFSYYGALLCCAGIFSVFAALPFPWLETQPSVDVHGVTLTLRYVGAAGFVLQMAAFAVAFVIDALGARMLGVREKVNPLRNLAHWASSPFVLLTYSVIAFVSIVRFVFEGKKMAGHDMAAKDGFAKDKPKADVDDLPEPTSVQHNEYVPLHSGKSINSSFGRRVAA